MGDCGAQQNDPSTAALLPILAQNLLITDKLTGLLNRTDIDTLFARLVKDALRRQERLAVILFDIDFSS